MAYGPCHSDLGFHSRANRCASATCAGVIDWVNAIDRMRNLRLKPDDELRALFEGRGVTPDKEVITYCQTHHRSAHTYFVLRILDYARVKGYPGSWSEWGNDPQLPAES